MNLSLVLTLLVVTAPAWGQQAPVTEETAPSAVETNATQSRRSGEPNAQRSITEDEGSKIEEIRVRGQTQRIVVTPKVGLTKSYEIITGDASRALMDGTSSARGATGMRVWNLLNF